MASRPPHFDTGSDLGPATGSDPAQPRPVPGPETVEKGLDAAVPDDGLLDSFRRSIDNIDAALIYMLAERFRITQAVGEYKACREMPAADPVRERSQIERLRLLAEEANLDPEFSEKFIRFVIDEVIRHHQRARQAAG